METEETKPPARAREPGRAQLALLKALAMFPLKAGSTFGAWEGGHRDRTVRSTVRSGWAKFIRGSFVPGQNDIVSVCITAAGLLHLWPPFPGDDVSPAPPTAAEAYAAAYRQGYGNGHHDAALNERFDADPGDSYEIWLVERNGGMHPSDDAAPAGAVEFHVSGCAKMIDHALRCDCARQGPSPEASPHPRCERPNCPEQIGAELCGMCCRLRGEDGADEDEESATLNQPGANPND